MLRVRVKALDEGARWLRRICEVGYNTGPAYRHKKIFKDPFQSGSRHLDCGFRIDFQEFQSEAAFPIFGRGVAVMTYKEIHSVQLKSVRQRLWAY